MHPYKAKYATSAASKGAGMKVISVEDCSKRIGAHGTETSEAGSADSFLSEERCATASY